jgi:hypothetical protein
LDIGCLCLFQRQLRRECQVGLNLIFDFDDAIQHGLRQLDGG